MNTTPIFKDSRGKELKELDVRLGRNRFAPWDANARRSVGASILVALFSLVTLGAVTQIDLTTQVKNILPMANGGTGAGSFTVHGVIVGENTSPFNATAAGTSGQPLLSGGASADPAYGTLGVAAGGTGATTLTNHGVVIGAGTSAVSISSAGTSGQCFTSNGASSDPTFQACPAAPNFADFEIPTGTINGSNVTFTLAHAPNPALSLLCSENGNVQRPAGADYTLSTLTITYGIAPPTGTTLVCSYRF